MRSNAVLTVAYLVASEAKRKTSIFFLRIEERNRSTRAGEDHASSAGQYVTKVGACHTPTQNQTIYFEFLAAQCEQKQMCLAGTSLAVPRPRGCTVKYAAVKLHGTKEGPSAGQWNSGSNHPLAGCRRQLSGRAGLCRAPDWPAHQTTTVCRV